MFVPSMICALCVVAPGQRSGPILSVLPVLVAVVAVVAVAVVGLQSERRFSWQGRWALMLGLAMSAEVAAAAAAAAAASPMPGLRCAFATIGFDHWPILPQQRLP